MTGTVNDNGIYRKITDADTAEYAKLFGELKDEDYVKTDSERIAELEAQLAELTHGYSEGVNRA